MANKDEEQRFKKIYNEAVNFLYENKPAQISKEQLEKYFVTPDKFKTKNKVLERLCGTLQNYQSMPKVIGFYDKKEREKGFRKILCDFDDKKILNKYHNYEELLNAFADEFDLDRSRFEKKNSSWPKYSKAVLSGSKFLSQFDTFDEFDHFVKLFTENEITSVALPLLLSKEIFGMEFALGCDFLKEIGYSQYPKPDVHLKIIFSELGLAEDDTLDCYKAVIRMAKYVNETAYKVDKVFWLIGSGNYYNDNTENNKIKIERKREEFIKYINKKGI